jgi:hypothetical protein
MYANKVKKKKETQENSQELEYFLHVNFPNDLSEISKIIKELNEIKSLKDIRNNILNFKKLNIKKKYFDFLINLSKKDTRYFGLGKNLEKIDDEIILYLFEYFTPLDLLEISLVSKAFYIFSNDDEIWRRLCITEPIIWPNNNKNFLKSWKITVLHYLVNIYIFF